MVDQRDGGSTRDDQRDGGSTTFGSFGFQVVDNKMMRET
jgi:hypothetical protein